MASYARTQTSNKNQVSVLAQAKPAIISASSNNGIHDIPTSLLSEKMRSALRFSPTIQDNHFTSFNNDPKARHIEDDNIIQRQNISNQMRQNAVMAAVASQQKVRLSATERLALTAKKPNMPNQLHQRQQSLPPTQMPQSLDNAPKSAPLPTLETLLAVQRQLQQHTKQNLNSVPQQVVISSDSKQDSITKFAPMNTSQRDKPLPPSPPEVPNQSERRALDHVTQLETYDKDLPPLPPSISPSTSTDDSQMNSLDSHQSSLETSLVSLPPPPPPLSAYLQQYDEVTSCERNSSSSSPSNASSTGMSSVKHYPLQVKSTSLGNTGYQNYDLPVPFKNNSPKSKEAPQPPALAPKPQVYLQSLTGFTQAKNPSSFEKNDSSSTNNQGINLQFQQISQARPVTASQPLEQPVTSTYETHSTYKPQIDYQQHLFTTASSSLPTVSQTTTSSSEFTGFDQPDSGNFRFPTPPPLDLLLDEGEEKVAEEEEEEEDDDEDFQCKIPTPPPYKSMSSVSFPDCQIQQQLYTQSIKNQSQQLQYHQASPTFNSSTFSVPSSIGLQPPPLFRQQVTQGPVAPSTGLTTTPAQLTVHINNDGGLLSTTDPSHQVVNHHRHHHHHHHIMMTMTASSSSPSSSSDGDGQSSNSSSSTSGIHSSIDSPSSSNSKLDDFNYGGKLNNSGKNIKSSGGLKKPLSSNSSPNYESHLKSNNNRSSCISNGDQGVGKLSGSMVDQTNVTTITARRPALKQKKTVSFSDKVELVACADEQSEDHLPNPLLARVLAGKLQ